MNILFCLLFTVVACYAQDVATGAIAGTVHDSSGALITSASVSAVRDQTHFSRSVRVNAEGSFRLSLLPPGSYSVTVQSDGFEQGLMHAIPVNVGEVTSLSLKLATGKVKVSVQVDATQPQTSALGMSRTNQQFSRFRWQSATIHRYLRFLQEWQWDCRMRLT